MKKIHINKKPWIVIGSILFVCLIAAWLMVTYFGSSQSRASFPIPLNFEGEYSQNGSEWQSLSDDTKLNALTGDLTIRGHFNEDIPDTKLHFYMDHIYMTLSVNGEQQYSIIPDDYEKRSQNLCAVTWRSYLCTPISSNDVVEIRLMNPHELGNPRAYNDFLDNIYFGPDSAFENFILHPSSFITRRPVGNTMDGVAAFLVSGQFWRTLGTVVLILSLLLLGVALADLLQHALFGIRLLSMSLFSLFVGSLMILDAPDIFLVNSSMDFNTCGAQVCRMLGTLGFCLYVASLLAGRWKKVSYIVITAVCIFDAGLAVAGLAGFAIACDLAELWCIVQSLLLFVLLCGCIVTRTHVTKIYLYTALILLLSVELEFLNAYLGLWQRGIFFNTVFGLTFLVCLVFVMRDVPRAYHAEKLSMEQENELAQNRISIMLSQIQPHFLYNSLNAICYLCKSDPDTAQEAIDEFATYLRGNLDSLKQTQPIPMGKELEHVRTYLSLEKLRFEEKLHIVWDIQSTDFKLPALTVQPLVENAVKYGVGKKANGGTVTISSCEKPVCFEVTVTDNGVGFDPYQTQDDGRTHIGIDNVSSRLMSMCHATLSIDSTPGIGTCATIQIPKE